MMLSRRNLLAGLAALPLARGAGWGQGPDRRPPARPALSAGRIVASAGLPGTVAFALLDDPTRPLADAAQVAAPMMPAPMTAKRLPSLMGTPPLLLSLRLSAEANTAPQLGQDS